VSHVNVFVKRKAGWLFAGFALFVAGVLVGQAPRLQSGSAAAGAPKRPSEISVSVPDGAGGRAEVQFTVAGGPYRDSDVQPKLGVDESVVTLFYFNPSAERQENVTYRGKPAPRR
jgi:hypothetical protein